MKALKKWFKRGKWRKNKFIIVVVGILSIPVVFLVLIVCSALMIYDSYETGKLILDNNPKVKSKTCRSCNCD